MKMITYQPNWLTISRDELIERLRIKLSSKRFKHVLGVEATGMMLAKRYHESVEKTSIVCLMHDYAKEMPDAQLLELALAYYPKEDLRSANGAIWHGFAAAQICKQEFACQDDEILQAIAFHTTGQPDMSQLAKILYLADYIEPGRQFEGVDRIRKKAFENLDQACYDKIRMSFSHLMNQCTEIYPLQLEAYNAWTQRIKKEGVI
ncbi:bis(5'-nucleosyl)-tetraphosphatase (symmetrical) YqeK [Facklamia hominis]|uniref:bis(5'-nucleosyl)-tetraphosphatase (symmetrical) YqeK n=1 Tax=Facklamia hominis TaxID=178214 RepID=UPI00101C9958|nr:bis(5'-nucleosyl)-tetraphosphatase (symmetrical) YqeK [Facklamia hominis]RYC97711.1 HD domain-containing protein [Facklamia hominis]WPJ91220.1 bis(5'-nucleosyl)-tetraphosphatase (symmetrical) YqeK [Facklamia hominis]